MQIIVNKDKIASELKVCDDAIVSLKQERKKLSTIVSDIGGSWKGKDYTEFNIKMGNFIKELEKFEGQLSSYNAFVSGYIKAENQLDSHYKTKKINIE